MSKFNTEAVLLIKGESYLLTEDEINFTAEEAEEWKAEDRLPPGELCVLIYEMINHKYLEDLDENSKKKLAADVLCMSYFQYSDMLFESQKEKAEKDKKRAYGVPSKINKVISSLDMERERLDAEARTGSKISRAEFLKAHQAKERREARKEKYKDISTERLSEITRILADYKSNERVAVEISTFPKQAVGNTTGISKVGGMADMLPEENYPVGKGGSPMRMVCQINLEEMAAVIGNELVPHKGLLVFYIDDQQTSFLSGLMDYKVRYYPKIHGLESKVLEDEKCKPYPAIAIQLGKKKTLPLSPWGAEAKVEELLGKDIEFLWELKDDYEFVSKSLFLGYGFNIELPSIKQQGKEVIDQIDDFLPLLFLNSVLLEPRRHPMNFGDAGSLGFFIPKEDWAKGDFTKVAFGYYN